MSPELREAQDALRDIWTQAKQHFGCQPHDPDSDFSKILSHHIADELDHIRSTNQHLYHVLLRNCEIFETIGVMLERHYIVEEDVNRRFRYALDRVHTSFSVHLDRIFDKHNPFGNAMKLGNRLKTNGILP